MPKEITKFHDRQVVVNTYVDEELVNRDGFWFDGIVWNEDSFQFFKEGEIVYSIDQIEGMELKKESVFKNYYSLNDANKKIEIYFP